MAYGAWDADNVLVAEERDDGVIEEFGPVGMDVVVTLSRQQAPQLVAALAERQQRRTERLFWLATTPPFLSAAEDGYRFLTSGLEALMDTSMEPVRVVVERALNEYREMFEGFIAGELTPLANAARTMMEVEWLLRCFVDDSSLVDRWKLATADDRRKFFAPAQLRKRLEQRHHQGLENARCGGVPHA